jgi:hypothetical protein
MATLEVRGGIGHLWQTETQPVFMVKHSPRCYSGIGLRYS